MMKKIFLSLILCVLISSLVLAQGQQGIHEAGTGITDPEIKEAGQGTGQGLENDGTETQEQNLGEETEIQNRVRTGEYVTENGEQIQIQEQTQNRVQLKSGTTTAETGLIMTQEQNRFRTILSNGKNAEIKIMPDTASERALERLRLKVCSEENNCSIELKEVGQGELIRAAYEIQAQKQAKLFGLFKTKMQVQAQVNAESGEIIRIHKPWWAILASETEE